jgi:hypothetical protein
MTAAASRIAPRSLMGDIVLFVALLSTAVALSGALAHLFSLPNKIGLTSTEYFIVQKAYAGWNRFAFVLALPFFSILATIWLFRRRPLVIRCAVAALICLVAAQSLFWIYTYPANVATENWTVVPADWELLRDRWEYSHAGGAVFQLLAMAALIVAALARARYSE